MTLNYLKQTFIQIQLFPLLGVIELKNAEKNDQSGTTTRFNALSSVDVSTGKKVNR
ncbi:MAG: hypothetical protein CM15mP85_25020 [Rhodobacterales bacterium]|nr:MAG: hypothetical protein CM15mP85_25020 [Rhodobacterales bacterium]